jgi:Amt family ammonium transporter
VTLAPNPDYASTIPEQTFMVYQLMFAIITPALITGALAERVKFGSLAVFLCLWSLLVYCPMAHMVWGVGGLLNINGGRWPCMDFAGGTVVHVTSGVSALVAALYLGKRTGYPPPGHIPHPRTHPITREALGPRTHDPCPSCWLHRLSAQS